jgi:hypothetical protein
MTLKRRKRSQTATWVLAAGVVLTGAAAVYAITRLFKSGPVARRRDMYALEKRVVQALLNDELARGESIDISAAGRGVVELSGAVTTESVARHVVDVVNGVAGVHAVVNRLEIRTVESRLDRNRKRSGSDATRWYGGSVGMGRRRQAASTDPDRRDDHVVLKSRALQPNRDDTLAEVEDAEGTGASIGVSRAGPFNTHTASHSPDPADEVPPPPPAVAPHEMAQRE